jgi:thiol-disulfide isomerase/thioredoxin
MKITFLLCQFVITIAAFAQHSITGTFPPLAGQQVRLVGFNGFDSYTMDSTKVSENGIFALTYTDKDFGMGYLAASDNKAYFIVLANENIQLKGEVLSAPETVVTLSGKENMLFVQYATEHPKREQALSAWVYLKKIYSADPLFTTQKKPQQAIEAEMLRIKKEDNDFLKNLDSKSYVRWILPIRKLVSSVSTIAQYRTEEIPAALAAFRAIDYTDPRLHKSGLLRDVLESHIWLIENSGRSMDSMYIEMQISIDRMVENLGANEKKLNEITGFLFKALEKRSLFAASEYLALKLLNEKTYTLSNDFASQLESYRAMKKGNTAPDFDFTKECLSPGYAAAELPKKLSDLKSKYTVVVFGASWCPQCPNELMQIVRLYEKWKNQSIEVVFISLDENEQTFQTFASVFPFISVCDYQTWESPVVKSYHVFATPTMYLLDDKRQIVLRPNSVGQLDSWVDWYLVGGNK